MSNGKCGKAGIVLFLSLALNVAAAGYIFGGGCGWHGHHQPFGDFEKRLGKLTEPAKSNVQPIVNEYRPKLKAQWQKVRALREQIDQAIKDPNYSRKQAEALTNKLKAETSKAQTLAQTMMLDIADKLSPEERAQFFDRPHARGPRHDDDDDKKPTDDKSSALPQ